jgi:hypothetical protein
VSRACLLRLLLDFDKCLEPFISLFFACEPDPKEHFVARATCSNPYLKLGCFHVRDDLLFEMSAIKGYNRSADNVIIGPVRRAFLVADKFVLAYDE